MKRIILLLIFFSTTLTCFNQERNINIVRNQSSFLNDYYNHFNTCELPFYTPKLSFNYDQLKFLYKSISTKNIETFIGKGNEDLGFNYVVISEETNEKLKGFARYDYYYLCKYKSKDYFLSIYIKHQGPDSTLIYIASYNKNGSRIDKLKLHGFVFDKEIVKSVINKDYSIKSCKYEPIENFKKTKITINNYVLNDSGKFKLINTDYKESNNNFIKYINSNKNPDDDPINDLPK